MEREAKSTFDMTEMLYHTEMVSLRMCFMQRDQTHSKPSWPRPEQRSRSLCVKPGLSRLYAMIDELVQDNGEARPC